MQVLHTKKNNHWFSSMGSFRDKKEGNTVVLDDSSMALFLIGLCYWAVCLYPRLVQVLPKEKCELCHNLPATEWKQIFDQRPVRAEKGREEVLSGKREEVELATTCGIWHQPPSGSQGVSHWVNSGECSQTLWATAGREMRVNILHRMPLTA